MVDFIINLILMYSNCNECRKACQFTNLLQVCRDFVIIFYRSQEGKKSLAVAFFDEMFFANGM